MKLIIKQTWWLEPKEAEILKDKYGIRPLARKLGMSSSYLCDIFNQKRPVSDKYVIKILNLLEKHDVK